MQFSRRKKHSKLCLIPVLFEGSVLIADDNKPSNTFFYKNIHVLMKILEARDFSMYLVVCLAQNIHATNKLLMWHNNSPSSSKCLQLCKSF